MAITDLPSELLIQIFNSLERVDLKAVRGSCRLFAETSSPSLFDRVLVAPRYQALGAFQNISSHPVYQGYVKEIVYDGSVYDVDLATNERAHMNHLSSSVGAAYRLDSWGRRKRFKQYQQLYRDQQDMRKCLILLRTLERALESMPNVHTVVYSPGPRHVPIEKKEVKDILPRGEPHIGHVSGSFEEVVDRTQHGFHTLIGALALTRYTGIRNFRVDAPDRDTELKGTAFTDYVFELSDESQLQAGHHLFSALHTVNLSISLNKPGSGLWVVSPEISTHMTTLQELLHSAKELRALSLTLYEWHPDPCRMYSQLWAANNSIIPYVFGKNTWLHLRSLHLEGLHARGKDFIGLLHRHDSTLRIVNFSYCALITGKWSEVVDIVLQTPRIDSFKISNVHEAGVEGDRYFIQLSAAEMREWIYGGELKVGAGGEREYVSHPDHEFPYAINDSNRLVI